MSLLPLLQIDEYISQMTAFSNLPDEQALANATRCVRHLRGTVGASEPHSGIEERAPACWQYLQTLAAPARWQHLQILTAPARWQHLHTASRRLQHLHGCCIQHACKFDHTQTGVVKVIPKPVGEWLK
jgi:hypothetical protein